MRRITVAQVDDGMGPAELALNRRAFLRQGVLTAAGVVAVGGVEWVLATPAFGVTDPSVVDIRLIEVSATVVYQAIDKLRLCRHRYEMDYELNNDTPEKKIPQLQADLSKEPETAPTLVDTVRLVGGSPNVPILLEPERLQPWPLIVPPGDVFPPFPHPPSPDQPPFPDRDKPDPKSLLPLVRYRKAEVHPKDARLLLVTEWCSLYAYLGDSIVIGG